MRSSLFFTIYGRVLGLLRPVRRLAVILSLANLVLAAVPFLDPILFGKAIDLLTAYVTRRTFSAQGEVEAYRSAMAERAGDAIGNVVLVQSFVRLSAEMRMMRDVIDRLLSAQFPVLKWTRTA